MPSLKGVPASSAPRSFSRNGTPRNGPSGELARRFGAGAVVELVDDRVEVRIERLHPRDRVGDELGRRDLLGADGSACAVASSHAVSSLMRSTVGEACRPVPWGGSADGGRRGSLGGRPRTGPDGDRLGDGDVGPARQAAAAVVELTPAPTVLEDRGPLALDGVAVTPLQQGDEHRPQVGTLLGQAVLAAQRALLIGPLHQDPLLDEPLQPRLEDVARHAQVALDVVEAPDAQEDVRG